MRGVIGLVLLLIGTSIAGAFGARNGATHVDYRAAIWVPEGQEAPADLAPPPPMQRLTEWLQAGGAGFGFGVVLIVGGAVLARQQQASDNAGGDASKGGRVDFEAALVKIDAAIAEVGALIANTPMDETAPEARAVLDALQADVIEPVVDGRGQLVARHGIGAFSEYFGPFSGGERLLNRTWSALTDGHPVVAREALAKSAAQFVQARAAWERSEVARAGAAS